VPEPVLRPGEILGRVAPGPAQVAHGLLGPRRHPDRHELARAQLADKATGVSPVGLHPIARGEGDERGGDHLAGDLHRGQQPVQLVAARTRLVTGAQHPPVGKRAEEATDRCLVVEHPFDARALLTGTKHPGDKDVRACVTGDVDTTLVMLQAGGGPAPSTLYVVQPTNCAARESRSAPQASAILLGDDGVPPPPARRGPALFPFVLEAPRRRRPPLRAMAAEAVVEGSRPAGATLRLVVDAAEVRPERRDAGARDETPEVFPVGPLRSLPPTCMEQPPFFSGASPRRGSLA